jgi:hypothetical protein
MKPNDTIKIINKLYNKKDKQIHFQFSTANNFIFQLCIEKYILAGHHKLKINIYNLKCNFYMQTSI